MSGIQTTSENNGPAVEKGDDDTRDIELENGDDELEMQKQKLDEERADMNKLNVESLDLEKANVTSSAIEEMDDKQEVRNITATTDDSTTDVSDEEAVAVNDAAASKADETRLAEELQMTNTQTAADDVSEKAMDESLESLEKDDDTYELDDTTNDNAESDFFKTRENEKIQLQKQQRAQEDEADATVLKEEGARESARLEQEIRINEQLQHEAQRRQDALQSSQQPPRLASRASQTQNQLKASTAASTSTLMWALFKCKGFLTSNWRLILACVIIIVGIAVAYWLYHTRHGASAPPIQTLPVNDPMSTTPCSQLPATFRPASAADMPLFGTGNKTDTPWTNDPANESGGSARDGRPATADKAVSRAVDGRTDLRDARHQASHQDSGSVILRAEQQSTGGKNSTTDKTDAPDEPADSEVFNISSNTYTYDDATAVCSALGARLATDKQVHRAYDAGANWCNYGWTHGQLALYPTQQATYDKLQQSDEHKNDCGKVGVNGGYFANKDLRFGVNCYGKKPEPSTSSSPTAGFFPDYISEKEKRLQDKINTYRNNLSEIEILPFNRNKWDKNRTVVEKISDVFS